ncbi:Protein of unknown function [Williamsia sterculiae]|uniref:DUF2993 domain-containing protein n=1 Tax=Williamsia sterculiae TaxID=1344003 RepID=A0A1N7GX62_9NOCA|nr:Protein of unknown function [Williamsia sterculiae]
MAVVIAVAAAVLVDVGAAIRAEHRFAVAVRSGSGLSFDPEITIGGFPFLRAAADHRYPQVGITARGVVVGSCHDGVLCRGDLRSALTDVRTDGATVTSRSSMRVSRVSGSLTIDSVNLGRFLDIIDLTVTTPAPRDEPGGGGPVDGNLSASSGILLTGTVPVPRTGRDAAAKVSVVADLSVVGGALRVQATGFYRGPEEHVTADVPDGSRAAVLAAFTRTLPVLPLPWGIVATSAHTEGSDVTVAGDDLGPTTLYPTDFVSARPTADR